MFSSRPIDKSEFTSEYLRLQFTDILGAPKSIEVPRSQVDRVLEDGIAFDGSSIDGFVRISESDMYLKPDLATLKHAHYKERSGSVICNVMTADGKPFLGDPRTALQNQLDKLDGSFSVGPEPEFFLLEDGEVPSDSGGYFDRTPIDKAEEVRRDIARRLDEHGFNVEASHHEVAAGQHEIDFRFDDALTIADRIIEFKLLTKHVALGYGYKATFMPKPFAGQNGSGMHCHMSVWSGDQNLFYDADGEYNLSDTARHFIGGVLQHVRGLCALTNPTVNSYKRLVPGYEAPVNICWGRKNRSALIRIPDTKTPESSTRIEMRNPDPACNPYLAFTAILAAGMDGMQNGIEPPDSIEENLYAMTAEQKSDLRIDTLPGSLDEALQAFVEDPVLTGALGSHITEAYLRAKKQEADEYRLEVSEWERRRYFNV